MTELMKRYEAETGKSASDELYSGSIKLYMPTNDYIAWLEDQLRWRPTIEKPKEGQIVFAMIQTGWVVAQYLNGEFYVDDGCIPCPFCGSYPESFNKGNEYTKKRGSVLKCNKCHYELTVCAIYQTIEWCKEKVLYNWNRRV